MQQRKFFAGILAAALLLSTMPVQAFAAEADPDKTVQAETQPGQGSSADEADKTDKTDKVSDTDKVKDNDTSSDTDKAQDEGESGDADKAQNEDESGDTDKADDDKSGDTDTPQAVHIVTYVTKAGQTTEEVADGYHPARVPDAADIIGWKDTEGNRVNPTEIEVRNSLTLTAVYAPALKTDSHTKFMNGNTKGLFQPYNTITRAEIAQVLYTLLVDVPVQGKSLADVPTDAWYAKAAEGLAALSIMNGDEKGNFRPDAPISRAECAVMLANFLPAAQKPVTYPDVPASHWAHTAISTAAASGIFTGHTDGTFAPGDAMTRAEAAAVFNRLLGRTPDANAIASAENLRLFPDVPKSHWAYTQIMEATVTHGHEAAAGGERWTSIETERNQLANGYYSIDGWLYRVQDGMFLRSVTMDSYTFDENGRYTTGYAALDTMLTDVIRQTTNDTMTLEQKLRALYNYVRDNFVYLGRAHVIKGQVGWEPEYAATFLETGKGNCFSYAAGYYMLVRELGVDANTVVGLVGRNRRPHGWVEIRLDGVNYMFDTELEMSYRRRGNYSYDMFKMLAGHTPFIYEK
jgi:hypothetical protein